jgi:hypothetical protein
MAGEGPMYWSISFPGMVAGTSVVIELDTRTAVARIEVHDYYSESQAIIAIASVEHAEFVKLVRVLMGWPVMHASITSIAETA